MDIAGPPQTLNLPTKTPIYFEVVRKIWGAVALVSIQCRRSFTRSEA